MKRLEPQQRQEGKAPPARGEGKERTDARSKATSRSLAFDDVAVVKAVTKAQASLPRAAGSATACASKMPMRASYTVKLNAAANVVETVGGKIICAMSRIRFV